MARAMAARARAQGPEGGAACRCGAPFDEGEKMCLGAFFGLVAKETKRRSDCGPTAVRLGVVPLVCRMWQAPVTVEVQARRRCSWWYRGRRDMTGGGEAFGV